MNSQLLISFALCAFLFQFTSGGKIIETVKEDIHKAGENIDCAFRDIGTFLGIGKRGPCEKGSDQKGSTDSTGLGQGGTQRNNIGQSGFEQIGFGQGGFGQAPGVGGNGFAHGHGQGQGQAMHTSGGFGQTGFGQGYSGQNNNGYNSLGQGEIGGLSNTQLNGYGHKSESTTGLGTTGKSGLDMRFESGSSSTASPESSTKKLEISGRRIISAHSNCPAGYVADSRGRCRETF
ncbi:ATP-dependent RNA helicase glh-2-like isoform X2 [Coccinella septempunctata]|uniref:ATP-dependent RNA helicase glh-2-like isoform X2 n=1 Tax=Coccinella septempunctata TaxID=41139 RepID=UPI001D06BB9A|nr:ATP-dependent RNA helicase glh-2-like isoform X2 [Coccinella septempunctata]